MVAGNAKLAALGVTDHHPWLHGVQSKQAAQIGAQGHGVLINGPKVGLILLHVVADHGAALVGVARRLTALKGDVGVVCAALLPFPRVPAPHGPGQGLDHLVPAHHGVDAGVLARLIPAFDKYLRIGLGHSGGVDHDPRGADGFSRAVAVAVGNQLCLLAIVHTNSSSPPFSFYVSPG